MHAAGVGKCMRLDEYVKLLAYVVWKEISLIVYLGR